MLACTIAKIGYNTCMYIPTLSEYLNAKPDEKRVSVKTYTDSQVESHARKHDPEEREAINARRREWLGQEGKGAAYEAKRRTAELNATPKWADLDAIAKIYKKRARVSKRTGIEYHVDHIIPLQGKTVCGLHVANNLKVVPYVENLRKGRIFKPQ